MQDMHGSNSFKLSQRNCIYHITPLLAVDLGVSQEEVYQFASFKEFSKKFLLPAQRFELSLLSIFFKTLQTMFLSFLGRSIRGLLQFGYGIFP